MSEEAVIDPTETFTATAVPLLKEYTAKVLALHEDLRAIKGLAVESRYGKDTPRIVSAEYDAVRSRFQRLNPAARAFAQNVSGMIDQGRVTPMERAELRLRLAELEGVLLETPALIQVYKPA